MPKHRRVLGRRRAWNTDRNNYGKTFLPSADSITHLADYSLWEILAPEAAAFAR